MMRVTLKEIAARAGVSVMAVSAAFNENSTTKLSAQKRDAIRKIADEMGYRSNLVAKTLRGGSSRIIGVMIDSCAPPSAYATLAAIESEAARHNYRVMIHAQHDSVESVISAYQIFEQYGADGIICMAYGYPFQEESFENFFSDKKNILLLGAPSHLPLPQIYIDLKPAYHEVLSHFLKLGRARIGAVICDMPFWSQQMRLDLYRRLCEEMNLNCNLFSPFYGPPGQMALEMDRCITGFIMPRKLDAIIIHSDILSAFLISGLARHGIRVPDDVAVITDDNCDFCAALQPPLTCIDINTTMQGTEAVRMLLQHLNGKLETYKKMIPCHLIWRESAGSSIRTSTKGDMK